MKITDRDYAAADKIALGQPFTCFECRDQLAELIARTRLAAYEEAAKVAETDSEYTSISPFVRRHFIVQAIRQLGEQ